MSTVSAQTEIICPDHVLMLCAVPNKESKVLLKVYIFHLNYSELLLGLLVHVG